LNLFIGAAKENLSSEVWTLDKKVKERLLTTTAINGFIICMRLIFENGGSLHDFQYLKKRLQPIKTMKLHTYKSSQYGAMGAAIYEKCFK
jgi:hypothetical protein